MGQLFIWSSGGGDWIRCPHDEITWLDRSLLSNNEDVTLHRAPRCAGLRYVHRRWELFSRDTTYPVHLAPRAGDIHPDAEAVQQAARRVLPVAPAHYETLPVVLEEGQWLVSVGTWVVALRMDAAAQRGEGPAAPRDTRQPRTQDGRVLANGAAGGRRGSPPRPDAVAHVRDYFERNGLARLAMAYYYQEFIEGLPAPQTVPMMDVVVAMDLSGEGAVSDYKKLLQDFIWNERGHPRELPEFLLSNGLLTDVDLDLARKAAMINERSGKSEMARKRLRYRPKK
ncbi:MAG TPA: hypothetical protein VG253_25455 [Streptosporangiaceae bacterium]|nr:hypothetical protein [Streptosporangiaceae bacterium]